MANKEALVNQLGECAEKQDFDGAFKILRENQSDFDRELDIAGIKDALKRTTKDRLLLAFIDHISQSGTIKDALFGLEKLISFQQGSMVLNKTWGLGLVRKLDYFYRRITVDFKTKKGHQFTFAAAIDMLERANDDHVLVIRQADPARIEHMLRDAPGEFVKLVIKSNGSSMTLIKLEDFCVQNGFVKAVNWKKFWESARAALKQDKIVFVPIKKTDPIEVRDSEEDYGDKWLTAFSQETDPRLILAAVREYVSEGKFNAADDVTKAKIGNRLAFAVTAARKTDDALFARLATQVTTLGFSTPTAEEMRKYLWERKRYIKAASLLPAREVGAMVTFLADNDAAKARLYAAIPELCFTAVQEVVAQFGDDSACRSAIGDLMRQPKAPATLTTLIVGKYEQFQSWAELPALIVLLTHAIALGEGRQGGEILKMQNMIRRLFSDKGWLIKVFGWLSATDKALFFERFQASIAWDPSTHHTTIVRMTHVDPELESHVAKVEKKREYARITSFRSFAMKKAEYLKLINEDMPANVKRIEFAKSYGDLSENAEYQYAKDEQRALMQKQSLMQIELETVKPGDFADATIEEVMPGVTVVVKTNDEMKTWSILGEWDNDLDKGIISSKTRVAQNMLGKKVGDDFELPDAEGNLVFATIMEIRELNDEIKDWMKLPEGMQI